MSEIYSIRPMGKRWALWVNKTRISTHASDMEAFDAALAHREAARIPICEYCEAAPVMRHPEYGAHYLCAACHDQLAHLADSLWD